MSLIEFTTPLTDSFGYGSIPAGAIPPGAVVLAVADIDDPSPELSLLGASQSGSMVVAIQEPDSPGGHMPFTQYVWNEMPLVSPSASAYGSAYDEENIPYLIDSVEGGQWIAAGGKYSYQSLNTHQLLVDTEPTEPNHVVRLADVTAGYWPAGYWPTGYWP